MERLAFAAKIGQALGCALRLQNRRQVERPRRISFIYSSNLWLEVPDAHGVCLRQRVLDPTFNVASNLDPFCLHVAITRTPATVAPVRFVVESNQNATEAFRVLVDFISGVYICFVLCSLQCTLRLAPYPRTRWS